MCMQLRLCEIEFFSSIGFEFKIFEHWMILLRNVGLKAVRESAGQAGRSPEEVRLTWPGTEGDYVIE